MPYISLSRRTSKKKNSPSSPCCPFVTEAPGWWNVGISDGWDRWNPRKGARDLRISSVFCNEMGNFRLMVMVILSYYVHIEYLSIYIYIIFICIYLCIYISGWIDEWPHLREFWTATHHVFHPRMAVWEQLFPGQIMKCLNRQNHSIIGICDLTITPMDASLEGGSMLVTVIVSWKLFCEKVNEM